MDLAADPPTIRVPDMVVVPTSVGAANPPRCAASDVLLAVAVISPGSDRTDRITKLAEYADAGIPNYWIVDLDPPATLTAYRLIDGEYEVVAESDGSVALESPAGVRIDVEALTLRRD